MLEIWVAVNWVYRRVNFPQGNDIFRRNFFPYFKKREKKLKVTVETDFNFTTCQIKLSLDLELKNKTLEAKR